LKKRSKYRYFSELEWAEQFMDGSLLFRSLSHFKKIEDGEVRGDLREGAISFQPEPPRFRIGLRKSAFVQASD